MDLFAKSGETFNLRHHITYCIVDILGELAFSEAFGNQVDEDPKRIPRVSEAFYAGCMAGSVPLFAPFMEWLKHHLPPSAEWLEMLEGRDVIFKLAESNVRRRAGREFERPDMLGKIMTAAEEKSGKQLTKMQVVSEAIALVLGGTHTTGNTLHILFANLSQNPQNLEKVIAEIDEKLPELEPTQPCYDITGLEEKLDLVNMAIKENFRKDPVGTFNMPRTVPAPGTTIAGLQIPSGVSINDHLAFQMSRADLKMNLMLLEHTRLQPQPLGRRP